MANPDSKRGSRDLRVKVKTARGRKLSSTRWLERQLNDPYVKQAKLDGMRGRAAYKLSEIDDKYRFLLPGVRELIWAVHREDGLKLRQKGLIPWVSKGIKVLVLFLQLIKMKSNLFLG